MIFKVLQRLLVHNFASSRRKFCQLALGNYSVKLDQNTVTGRILCYFDPNVSKQAKKLKNEVQILQHIKRGVACNLQDKSTEEIKNLLLLTDDPRCVRNKYEFLKVFERLDSECCFRVDGLEVKDILDILRIYMQITPTKLTQFKFYETTINKLSENIYALTKNELLQFMFFVGHQKKVKNAQNILRKCMRRIIGEFINILTAEELCVICNATFKTTTRISNKLFLDRVRDFINDNLCVLKDPAIFITFVKTLRQNQYQDDNLLSTISYAVFFNKTLKYYGFSTMCHILALYADYMYYDENVLKHFSTQCIEELKKSKVTHRTAYITEQVRDKDLKRLLWCLSRLGYNLDTNTIKTYIVPNIVERIQKGDLSKDRHSLVEIILYLWLMNFQAVELLPYALTQESVSFIYESHLTKRLNLLLTAIYFENRPIFRDLNIKLRGNPNFNKQEQISSRPLLKRVMDCLKVIMPKTDLSKFEYTSQIPYIDIVGITGFKKNIYKTVHIEVLDETICLKNTEFRPSGIAQMKLRILDGFEEALIVVGFVHLV